MSRIDLVLDAIDRTTGSRPKKIKTGWQALCPAHDDKNASLSINEKLGKILLYCHAGCETRAIVDKIGLTMRDLFDGEQPRSGTKSKIVATYPYTDEAGALLFEVVRFEPKDFRQRRLDDKGEWAWSLDGVRRVLYLLPDVLEAAAQGKRVFVVEGEKDAESLTAMGLVATTNSGGTGGGWRPEYSESLRGADVVIIPDNDTAGLKHAQTVAQSTHGKILRLPEGKDVTEWIENHGGTREKLLTLVESTPAADASKPPIFERTTFSELELASALLSPRCIVEKYLYADVAALFAPGGAGKTTLLLYEAIHIALGRRLYGLEVRNPGKILIVSAEDTRTIFAARLRELMKAIDLTAEERATVLSRVGIWDVVGLDLHLISAHDGNLQLTALADEIVNAYRDNPPALVVFDPLISFGADEERINSNEQALITAARRIVKGLNCCCRMIHHTGKANAREKIVDQYAGRGGSALSDGSRMVAVLAAWTPSPGKQPPPGCTPGDKTTILQLVRAKLSYVPPQPMIWLRRQGWKIEAFADHHETPEEHNRKTADQLERFLMSETKAGRRYTARSLDSIYTTIQISRADGRAALVSLMAAGKISENPLSKDEQHGSKKTYLETAQYGAVEKPPPKEDLAAKPFSTAPPLREKGGGAVLPPPHPSPIATAPAQFGAVRRNGAVEEKMRHYAAPVVASTTIAKAPDKLILELIRSELA